MKPKRKLNKSFDTEATLIHHLNYHVAKPYIKGRRILDVGCWTGQLEKLAIKSAKHITGLDPNPTAIAFARKNNPDAEFIIGKAQRLPFAENTFETVIFSEVIEHLPKNTEKEALDEIHRVLQPKGSLVLTTPNKHLLSILFDPAYFLSGHRHYSLDELQKFIENSGFRILKKFIRGNIFQLIDSNLRLLSKHLLDRNFKTPTWIRRKIRDGYKRGGFVGIHIISEKI